MTKTDALGVASVAVMRAREIADLYQDPDLDQRAAQLAHLDTTKAELRKAIAYLAAQYVNADTRNPAPVHLEVLLRRVQGIADDYQAYKTRKGTT